jgi:thiol-disulfide isomerase/thioredoxin
VTPRRILLTLISVLLAIATGTLAQTPAPPPPAPAASPALASPSPSPSPTPSPVSAIRGKLAAGDLLSAESVLEVHRLQHGEDGPWLVGLSWLGRGAFMLGDMERTQRYASRTRAVCAQRIARGDSLEKDHDLEAALGAAIEVEAQRLERLRGPRVAAEYARGELARLPAMPALRSRIQKRINLLTLVGTTAPELVIEDAIGAPPPTLASMRGRPIVLFVWAEWCGDCRGQSGALAKMRARYAPRGVQFVTVTRYYDDAGHRVQEKARVDSVWKAVYADVGPLPSVISTASMERYGGSSTPTFVFIDKRGIVRDYAPTRLTEEELERRIAAIEK